MANLLGNANVMNKLVNPAGMNTGGQPQPQQQVQPQPQPQQQQSGPDLGDLSFFNNRSYGGVSEEEANGSRGQALLNNLRKYDPTAQFTPTQDSSGNMIGYQLQFDPSKLPGSGISSFDNNGNLGGANPYYQGQGGYTGGSGFIPKWVNVDTSNSRDKLINPNAIYNSDHYGNITSYRNVRQEQGDWLSKLGPMAIIALGTFLSGGALSPLASLMLKAPQTIMGAMNGNFNPLQLASYAMPFIPGMGQISQALQPVMPYLNAGRTAYSLYNATRRP